MDGTPSVRISGESGEGGHRGSVNTTWTYASPRSHLVSLNVTDRVNVSVQDAAIVEIGSPAPSRPSGAPGPAPWIEIGALGLLLAGAIVGLVLLRRRARRPPAQVTPPPTVGSPAPAARDEGPENGPLQR